MSLLKCIIGFRKFIIMILFLIVMITFRVLEYIDGSQFADNLQVAVVAFFGTNIGEHIINVGKDYIKGRLSK